MAPIRPFKSSLSLLQPPKGTQHKQHAHRHNESSDHEDGETMNKAKRKHKHDPLLSADDSMDRPLTMKKMKRKQKKQKKSATMTDAVDEGD